MNIKLKKTKKRKGFRLSNLIEPFRNERNHKKIGFILILISTYLLIACISFIENWKKDIDKLSGNWTELIINTDIVVDNSLGKIGAIISHWLIFQGIGIASFIIIFLLIIIG